MIRPLALTLVFAGVMAAALAAVSGEARASVPDSPWVVALDRASLTAGESVELTWTSGRWTAEEMELLLSIDDGRSFPIRVSPEIAPGRGHYSWRVPNLPAARARIRARVRVNGHETWMAPGEPFVIVGSAGATPERRQVHEAGWWSGVEPESGEAPVASLASPATRFEAATHATALERTRSAPSLIVPESSRPFARASAYAHTAFVARRGGASPVFVPARE